MATTATGATIENSARGKLEYAKSVTAEKGRNLINMISRGLFDGLLASRIGRRRNVPVRVGAGARLSDGGDSILLKICVDMRHRW